ncbi:hypothetical protein [Tessaracoccus antarcticus]|uniref:Uncharacterized protein n=1 Tax=Tessaracoccus antarcticus TaxID=2479848 RepID=A0A3M0G2C9_9ACTN|nr:hypothetical protein [Tessaracoccus antarcticus]RMB58925.1 hypothetical protein EAX62_12510 [Tessaracoccus antarcticus]
MADHHHPDTTAGADNAEQDQQQQRIQAEERVDLEPSDMEEAIDHEHDQKVDPGDASRYEGAVDDALPGNNS